LETSKKWIFFLPKPAHYALQVEENFKDFNKVELISQTVWEQGWPFETWADNCLFLQNGKAVMAKSDFEGLLDLSKPEDLAKANKIKLYDERDSPRVKIHAPTRDDAYFQLSTVSTANNHSCLCKKTEEHSIRDCVDGLVHLYFLVETKKDYSNKGELMAAIRMLPDRGIGGERSTGCGQLHGIQENIPFHAPKIGQSAFCSVSLTLPEDLTAFHYYDVETRGGRQYGGEGKKFDYVRMLSEGAVANKQVSGQVIGIGTNEGHEVQRYGQPFYLETQHIEEQ
jgi:CRISPR-associated protein Csm4